MTAVVSTPLAAFWYVTAVRWRWLVIACVLTVPALLCAQTAPEETQGVILINTDREIEDFLRQAQVLIADGQHDKAVELLQSVVTSDKRVFVRRGDEERRSASPRAAAMRLLGKLPADVLQRYARQSEGPAGKLLAEALVHDDQTALVRVASEFFHTRSGETALNQLAARAFDRAEYLSAALAWETLYREHRVGVLSREMLATKACVAYHLAGEENRAAAMLAALRENHPRARGTIAGEETDLAAFAAEVMRQPPAPVTMPAGTAAIEANLFPLWAWPADAAQRASHAQALAGVCGAAGLPAMQVTFDAGRPIATLAATGQAARSFPLPAVVHPLVVGDRVVCRMADGVMAFDMDTGQVVWECRELPLYRDAAAARGMASNPFVALAGEMGRCTLSTGGEHVYAVGRFRLIDPATYRKFVLDGAPDSSTLAAIRAADGKVIWEVGHGKGTTEVARSGKYLAAPAVDGGRLYAMVRYASTYWAVCLDQRTGATIWETGIGPITATAQEATSWQVAYTTELLTERGTSPVVSGGCVYLTTNAGLVVALDASSGQVVFGYQYDSQVSGKATDEVARPLEDRAYLLVASRRPVRPANPLIVTGGRVICLPADSDAVFALCASDGSLLWQQDRQEQDDLSAIDEGRVLLSGPDLVVLSAASGRTIKSIDDDVVGRPAVAAGEILACGRGKVLRVARDSYAVTAMPLTGDEAVSGALAVAGGRLICVSAAGVGVCVNYDKAWALLAKRIDRAADAAQRTQLRVLRGQFALSAGKIDVAAGELRLAHREAQNLGDQQVRERAREMLHAVLLRQADGGDEDKQVGQLLAEASRLAVSPRQQAAVALRTVKHHERFGRPGDAAREAQALAEKFAEVLLDDGQRILSGRDAGQQQIAALIARHGQGVYAPIDKHADAALASTRARGDVAAMLAAHKRWPHAASAPAMLWTAAQALLKQAAGDDLTAARAQRVLVELCVAYPQSPQAADARKALEAMPDQLADINSPLQVVATLGEGRSSLLRDEEGRPITRGHQALVSDATGIRLIDVQANDTSAAELWHAPIPATARTQRRIGQLSADQRRLCVVDGASIALVDATSGKVLYQKNTAELGISAWMRLAGGGDRVVFLMPRGGLVCVDTTDGTVAWRSSSREGTMQTQGEMMLLADRDRRGTVYDMRTGRAQPAPGGRHGLEALLTEDELLASVIHGDVLGVFDPRRSLRTPQWSVPLGRNQRARLLGTGGRHIAVHDANDGVLRLYDVADLAKPIAMKPVGDATPTQALFTGRRVYMLSASAVSAYDLPAQVSTRPARLDPRWKAQLPADSTGQLVTAQTLASSCLVVVAPADARKPPRYLLVRPDGSVVDCADAAVRAASAAGLERGQPRPALPVIVYGRLLVEMDGGVVLLRSDL